MKIKQLEPETDDWTAPRTHRKDTGRWCKGHTGIEHEASVMLAVGPYRAGCGMRQSYKEPGHDVWHCDHIVRCSNCGKVLESLPSDDCPDRPAA